MAGTKMACRGQLLAFSERATALRYTLPKPELEMVSNEFPFSRVIRLSVPVLSERRNRLLIMGRSTLSALIKYLRKNRMPCIDAPDINAG